MAHRDLTALIVVYDEITTAVGDFGDLATARQEERVGSYDAAVIEATGSGPEVIETTITMRERATLRGAGVGLVAGAVFVPAVAGAILGAGLGAVVGNLVDRIEAFRHADLEEVARLAGTSAASLIVLADPEILDAVTKAALGRGRRIVVPFTPADVRLLKVELQQIDPGLSL